MHIVAEDGTLLAQSDGIPANWTRPTTGWQLGEYITDEHQLTLPASAESGKIRILVGMYLPDNGRLTTRDGSDAISIDQQMTNDK